MRDVLSVALAFLALLAIACANLPVAWGHDPFTGLRNSQGGSCCSSEGPSSDCKTTITRYAPNGHLQAQIDERWREYFYGAKADLPMWVDIPDDKILSIEQNPLGGEVVCWLPHIGVMCFLPGRGT